MHTPLAPPAWILYQLELLCCTWTWDTWQSVWVDRLPDGEQLEQPSQVASVFFAFSCRADWTRSSRNVPSASWSEHWATFHYLEEPSRLLIWSSRGVEGGCREREREMYSVTTSHNTIICSHRHTSQSFRTCFCHLSHNHVHEEWESLGLKINPWMAIFATKRG